MAWTYDNIERGYDIQNRIKAQYRLVYVFGPDKRTARRILRLRRLHRAVQYRMGYCYLHSTDNFRAWLARGTTSICKPVTASKGI
jgi:hypothetical protein